MQHAQKCSIPGVDAGITPNKNQMIALTPLANERKLPASSRWVPPSPSGSALLTLARVTVTYLMDKIQMVLTLTAGKDMIHLFQ